MFQVGKSSARVENGYGTKSRSRPSCAPPAGPGTCRCLPGPLQPPAAPALHATPLALPAHLLRPPGSQSGGSEVLSVLGFTRRPPRDETQPRGQQGGSFPPWSQLPEPAVRSPRSASVPDGRPPAAAPAPPSVLGPPRRWESSQSPPVPASRAPSCAPGPSDAASPPCPPCPAVPTASDWRGLFRPLKVSESLSAEPKNGFLTCRSGKLLILPQNTRSPRRPWVKSQLLSLALGFGSGTFGGRVRSPLKLAREQGEVVLGSSVRGARGEAGGRCRCGRAPHWPPLLLAPLVTPAQVCSSCRGPPLATSGCIRGLHHSPTSWCGVLVTTRRPQSSVPWVLVTVGPLETPMPPGLWVCGPVGEAGEPIPGLRTRRAPRRDGGVGSACLSPVRGSRLRRGPRGGP